MDLYITHFSLRRGSLQFSSYSSTYLDVFSEGVVIKLFCIYFRLNTQLLSFYVLVWIYFFCFCFCPRPSQHIIHVLGTQMWHFEGVSAFSLNCFQAIQIKVKYINVRQCFLRCFCFKGQCSKLSVFLTPKFYSCISYDTFLKNLNVYINYTICSDFQVIAKLSIF